jgi:hypothetical protein
MMAGLIAMKFEPAPYVDWRQVMSRVLEGETSVEDEQCPTCSEKALHLQYVGDPQDRVGFATLWCSISRDGIISGRLTIPTGAELLSFGDPEYVRRLDPLTIIPSEEVSSEGDEVFDGGDEQAASDAM